MNLQGAIKSGKKFKRTGWSRYFTSIEHALEQVHITDADILANDWEIEQENKKITLYRHTYKNNFKEYTQSEWTSVKRIKTETQGLGIVNIESKEIEVDA